MEVKWTETKPLHEIPEHYWGEDLSELDQKHEGTIIGTSNSFWFGTALTVACTDGKIRTVNSDIVDIINPTKH